MPERSPVNRHLFTTAVGRSTTRPTILYRFLWLTENKRQ